MLKQAVGVVVWRGARAAVLAETAPPPGTSLVTSTAVSQGEGNRTPVGASEVGQLLGAIFAESPDAVIVADDEGRIVLSSPAVRATFGYYPEELVGEQIEMLIPEELRTVHHQHRERFASAPSARQMGSALELFGHERDGAQFPIDVSLAPVEVHGRHFVAAFVRDASERQRATGRLRAINEITNALLAGASVAATLPTIAGRAQVLVDAVAAWIVTPSSGAPLVVAAAAGELAERLVGFELSETSSRSALVMQAGKPEVLADLTGAPNVPEEIAALGLGAAIYAPLITDERRVGILIVARSRGEKTFDDLDRTLIEVFAGSAALAMALGNVREELEVLSLLADEERIARDLHDNVIQQLFAVGLSLQAVQNVARGVVSERLSAAIDVIDEVIREIRNTIFAVNRSRSASVGLQDRVQGLLEEMSALLGFRPRFRLLAPTDIEVPSEIVDHVLAVIRESLSNIARHAHASRVDVVIHLRDDVVRLSVADDGVGFPGGPSAGSGLTNMAERARSLGGSLATKPRNPTGTLLEWEVPIGG